MEDNRYGINIKLMKKNFFLERKLWNKVFGTKTIISQLFLKNYLFFAYSLSMLQPLYFLVCLSLEKKLWNRGFYFILIFNF